MLAFAIVATANFEPCGYTVELLINETVNGETIRFVISQFVNNKISVLRYNLLK